MMAKFVAAIAVGMVVSARTAPLEEDAPSLVTHLDLIEPEEQQVRERVCI